MAISMLLLNLTLDDLVIVLEQVVACDHVIELV